MQSDINDLGYIEPDNALSFSIRDLYDNAIGNRLSRSRLMAMFQRSMADAGLSDPVRYGRPELNGMDMPRPSANGRGQDTYAGGNALFFMNKSQNLQDPKGMATPTYEQFAAMAARPMTPANRRNYLTAYQTAANLNPTPESLPWFGR